MFKKISLERLQDRFIELIEQIKVKENTTQEKIAEYVLQPKSVLNEIMKKKRKLSTQYAYHYIWRGKIMVSDLYDNKPESEREKRFWDHCIAMHDKQYREMLLVISDSGANIKDVLAGYITAMGLKMPKP